MGEEFSSSSKKAWLSFTASLQEAWQHVKAGITGQVKKVKARNEKEASEADLQTAKMQVEATDAAEDRKRQLDYHISLSTNHDK